MKLRTSDTCQSRQGVDRMWDTQQSTMYEEEEEESIVCALLKASVTVC
jgi:hypothetical protein